MLYVINLKITMIEQSFTISNLSNPVMPNRITVTMDEKVGKIGKNGMVNLNRPRRSDAPALPINPLIIRLNQEKVPNIVRS